MVTTEFEMSAADVDQARRNLERVRQLIDTNNRLLALARENRFHEIVREINDELKNLKALELTAFRLVRPFGQIHRGDRR